MNEAVASEAARALGTLDLRAVRAAYRAQNEFVCLERCLPPPLLERLLADVERVRPAVHRVRVPGKKSHRRPLPRARGARSPEGAHEPDMKDAISYFGFREVFGRRR